MEVQLSKNLNEAIEELQEKIKAVTGKHRSKKYLLQQLVDTGMKEYYKPPAENTNEYYFPDIFNVEPDGVIVSVVFAPETANEISRIMGEENTIGSENVADVTKIQVINAMALIGLADYSRPYDEILSREKQTA